MKTEVINLPDIVGKGYKSFWNDRHRYRVVKGGKGSKKSYTAALWFIYSMMKHHNANTLVVRKVKETHKDSTFAQLKVAARRLGVINEWKFKESPLEAVYKPTGQKILFRGFDDVEKIASITVDVGVLCWVWVEEAFEIESEEEFTKLDLSIRGEMPDGLTPQLTLTFNPWVYTHWTKTRFFDNQDPDAFTQTTTYVCNEFLTDFDRMAMIKLKKENPELYKVIGLGEYGMPGGAYFNEFRRDIHVIEPFVLDESWRRYRVFDYGLDMLACYWIAIDNHDNWYVYKELYEGLDNGHPTGHIVSSAAKRIHELTDESIYQTIAPPDMRNHQKDSGKSTQELFRDNGIVLTIANNNRVQGWLNVKERLKIISSIDENGNKIEISKLVFFSNCRNIIRTLPQVQRDEKNPNDVANTPHELTHAPDAIRYFCASMAQPYKEPPKPIRTEVDSFISYGGRR